jgi:hypothetical protein
MQTPVWLRIPGAKLRVTSLKGSTRNIEVKG